MRAGDADRLVRELDSHRGGALEVLCAILGPGEDRGDVDL